MPPDLKITSERLGALPIINHFLSRLRLPTHLSAYLPTTEAALPFGKVLSVLLRNLILDRGPIYGTEEWVLPFAPHLLGLAREAVEWAEEQVRARRA
jgi:hypothetical protein